MPHVSVPRPRHPLRVLVIGVLTVAALVLPTTGAEAAVRTRVSAAASALTFIKGETVTVSGTVTGKGAHRTVVVERRVGKKWVRLASTRSTAAGRYSVKVRPPGTSKLTYRVRVAARKGATSATTSTRSLAHYTCSAGSAPADGVQAVFNTPGSPGAFVSRLRQTICSAAPRSTLRIALYILDTSDSQSASLVRAVKAVSVERGVKTYVVLDATVGASARAAAKAMASFAHVTLCQGSCAGAAGGHMHTKLVAISDSTWASGTDPVVVLGSANWSDRQLSAYWQSATVFHRDVRLHAAYARQFDAMRSCASRRCTPGEVATIATDPGRGTSVDFYARTSGDATRALLQSVTCTPGATIDVAMYISSTSRARRMADELQRLARGGCRVRVVVSDGGAFVNAPATLAQLARPGVSLRCTTLMHGKFLLMRGVTVGGRTGQTIVQDGSRNWSYSGLRLNDDATFTLSTHDASASGAKAITKVAGQYASGWAKISAASHTC